MNLQQLSDMKHQAEVSTLDKFPAEYLPRTKYSDKTANGLTRCIIDFIRLTGGHAERVSNMGRQIGSGRNRKWIPGTGTNGTADISATKLIEIEGRKVGIRVAIEVKVGRDRQSAVQREYQCQIEQAGGVYLVANDFKDFIIKWNNIV